VLKLIPAQLPWWLGGPGLGLCVVALYGLANRRLGVSGVWLAAVVAPIERGRGGHGRGEHGRGERWPVEFLIALVAGAVAAGLLGSDTRLTSYPVLSGTVPAAVLLPLVTVAGLALGYGARWAGGCTSGHGIAGCPAGSPDSFAVTATFFGVAVAVAFGAQIVTGGAL
jgi:hypothetical protein